MSGICGFVGEADPAVVEAMLAAIDYRGDRSDTAFAPGVGLGYRWWGGRPGKSPGIHREGSNLAACAGTLAPSVDSPAAALLEMLGSATGLDTVDGAFAMASWDANLRQLTLVRDPFGIRSLYHVRLGETFYFASELKQLLGIPGLPVEIDPAAVHKYLTFSFVPGEDVPIRGIQRLLPGRVARLTAGRLESTAYHHLREEIDPKLEDKRQAVRLVRRQWREAVARRLVGEREVGVYLSGGIDSSGVAFWLHRLGASVRALSLDFGERSVEKEQAALVAGRIGIPISFLRVDGSELLPLFEEFVWRLDLPFGDPVTGPQYLLGRAARDAGLSAVFNGEGGDQFFGGWTNKPMVAAEIYADLYGEDSREEQYLESYHRFYGREQELYTPAFQALVGGPGQRRAHLVPYLQSADATTFLNRIRLADIGLKGSQNIIPRAERMANAWGVDVRMPLFDRAFARASFTLPPQMKLNGACEKYVLKLSLQKHLPEDVVWRKKLGMSVPVTDWVLGPLAELAGDLLSPRSLEARGFFRTEYVSRLLRGENEVHETRRRRLGEKIWTLLMIEAWFRIFVDGRGRRPGSARP